MADEKKKAEAAGDDASTEEQGAKSGKKRMIIMATIGLVVLLAAGGGAFFFLSGGSKADSAAPHEAAAPAEHGAPAEAKHSKAAEGHGVPAEAESDKSAEGHGADKGAAKPQEAPKKSGEDFGDTLPLKTFHLNLGNPLENRYVRLEISLEYRGGEEQKKELEQRMPQLRDAVVSIVSRKTREFLLSPDGKDQLRKEIHVRINRYMTKPITSVFITDLLIE